MSDLEEIKFLHSKISQFKSPEEMFGELKGDTEDEQLKSLSYIYRNLVKKYHPDKYNNCDAITQYLVGQITSSINEFYSLARKRIEQKIYGKPEESIAHEAIFEFATQNHTYRIFEHLAEGDYTNVYKGEFDLPDGSIEQVCVKIIKDSEDNDLMENEIRVYKLLQHKSLPVFIEKFKTTDYQIATVTRYIDGYDFVSIREKYKDGVPQEHIVWIFERLLSVLGFMHYNKVIHGNITPENILVRPRDHNVFLIDFLFSIIDPVTSGETYKIYTEDYSAPEVQLKKSPIPSSDMYSLGKCIVYLLGGNVKTNELPKSVDKRIKNFLMRFLHINPIERTRDAWKSWHELSNLREEVFGSRHQFLEFVVD